MLKRAEAFALACAGCAAIGLLAAAAFVVLSRQGRADNLPALAGRARPRSLIAVGVLIFMDTVCDTQ